MKLEKAELGSMGPIGQEPPSEFRVFGMGSTRTKKGEFVLTKSSGEAIMKAFRESGLDALPFDAGHASLGGALVHPDSHKALGWFEPEMRDDGLHATNVQFTKRTLAALSDREFRFFSPAVLFDSRTREVRELTNIALTNLPATIGQKPLVLDSQEEEENHMKPILEKLGAADETAALAAVVDLQSKLASSESEIATLSSQLTNLTAQSVKDKRDGVIAMLSADGKLPPAQRAFAESLSLDQLSAFAETLSVKVSRTVVEPTQKPDGELTAEELSVVKLTGVSKEDFIKEKARLAGKE